MQDYIAEAQGWLQIPTGSRAGQFFSVLKKETCIKKCLFFPCIKKDLSGAPMGTENFCSSSRHVSECKSFLCLTLGVFTPQMNPEGFQCSKRNATLKEKEAKRKLMTY